MIPRRRARDVLRGRHRVELAVGWAILAAVVTMSLVVPALASHGPNDFVGIPYSAPSGDHPFGTDSLGRDVFVRVWSAGRLDLGLALLIVGISLLTGTAVGIWSGLSRWKWLDTVLMRFVDGLTAFPFLILILVVTVVVGSDLTLGLFPPGALSTVIAILIVNWALYARLARTETLTLRERDFVTAARVIGYPPSQIARRHLFPGVIRVTGSFAVADIIIIIVVIASLSFLGAGIQAPVAEWGGIMYEGRSVLATSWWISTFPGLVLVLTGISLGLIADALLEGKSS